MNKKMLKNGLLVTVFSLLFALTAIYMTNLSYPKRMVGQPVFLNTITQGLDVNKVILKDKNNELTFVLENGFWLLKEADYYYANLVFLNQLFEDINTSRYYGNIDYSEEIVTHFNLEEPTGKHDEHTGILLKVFNKQNQILDNIIIGSSTDNDLYHVLRRASQKEILIADGKFSFPDDLASWLQQPLISYTDDMIEKVELISDSGKQSISRPASSKPFYNDEESLVNMRPFLNEFGYFTADTVSSAQNFDESLHQKVREIHLTTLDRKSVV